MGSYDDDSWRIYSAAKARKPHPAFSMTLVSRAQVYAFMCPFCRLIHHSSVSLSPPVCTGGFEGRYLNRYDDDSF